MRQSSGHALTCRDVVERLDDHLDGCLPLAAQRAVRSHLAGCADCRHYLRGYANAIRAARRAFRQAGPKRGMSKQFVASVLSKWRGSG